MASMHDALQAFLNHKPKKAGNVESTGEVLLSYGWWEMARWHDGQVIVRTGSSYSKSTQCQRTRLGLYRWTQATNPTPSRQASMEL